MAGAVAVSEELLHLKLLVLVLLELLVLLMFAVMMSMTASHDDGWLTCNGVA